MELTQLRYYGWKSNGVRGQLEAQRMSDWEIDRDIGRCKIQAQGKGADGELANLIALEAMDQVPPKS